MKDFYKRLNKIQDCPLVKIARKIENKLPRKLKDLVSEIVMLESFGLKMIFRVCIPCQKSQCDCSQYDGLEMAKMPKDWKPHDDSKHNHNCYCTFEFKAQREGK